MHDLRILTRWTDFDALGHLTHAAYPVFLDEARDAFERAASLTRNARERALLLERAAACAPQSA